MDRRLVFVTEEQIPEILNPLINSSNNQAAKPNQTSLFPVPQLTPSGAQLTAMQQLVNTMQLVSLADTSDPSNPPVVLRELLNPRETPNPALQRFLWFVGQRQLDPGYQLQPADEDEVAAAVLEPPVGLIGEGVAAALQQLGEHFKTQVWEGQGVLSNKYS